MAGITGVGAKKLDQYGDAFLSVINGATETVHPTRRKLAGKPSGSLYDRLLDAQNSLKHGETGTEKPLSCSTSLLAKVASTRPRDSASLIRILGERRAERFGPAFLDVLAGTD